MDIFAHHSVEHSSQGSGLIVLAIIVGVAAIIGVIIAMKWRKS